MNEHCHSWDLSPRYVVVLLVHGSGPLLGCQKQKDKFDVDVADAEVVGITAGFDTGVVLGVVKRFRLG